MDISSLMGGGNPIEDKKEPEMEYSAQVTSPLLNGEVKLVVEKEGLAVTALFDAAEIPYAQMHEFLLEDYQIKLHTSSGKFTFSRLGNWCVPFYDALLDAYNKKVSKALFISENPLLTTKSEYEYFEGSTSAKGFAPVKIYERCVCILPQNLDARSVPLCFVTGLDKGDYELTLRTDIGDSYTFSKLGYDFEPFTAKLEGQIRKLREKTLEILKELDSSLTMAQASAIAKLMPEGIAAPLGKLAVIAPSFVVAIEDKMRSNRADESYDIFKEICDKGKIWVGFRKKETGKSSETTLPEMITGMIPTLDPDALIPGGEGTSLEKTAFSKDQYVFWLIVPSPNGRVCAVEFLGEDAAATFIYNFSGEFDDFARKLNRALVAIDFKREVIRLSPEELAEQENADYRMAIDRNAYLRFVRSCFVGRAIHSNSEAWKKKLLEMFEGEPSADSEPEVSQVDEELCKMCGAKRDLNANFCGSCGARR